MSIHLKELDRATVLGNTGDLDYFTAEMEDAYANCLHLDLRMDQKTTVMRDNTGILSYPVNPSGWPAYDREDVEHDLIQAVKSEAVRLFNIKGRSA